MALDSKHLRSLIVLGEELHFGRAAERLDIAQSVLSAQVKRIEDVIGGRLLDRGRRATVRLTPAGLIFLREARAVVAGLDRAERIGRLATQAAAGHASLGYVFSAAMSGVLTRTLAAVRERLPEIELHAAPIETPEQIAAIADARLDVGFIRPRDSYPPDIRAQIVHSEPLLLAIGMNHPLADRHVIGTDALEEEIFIVPQVGGGAALSTAITDLARAGGYNRPACIDTGDFVTAVSMAASGHGVVLAPRSLANLGIAGICYREIDDFAGSVDLALAYRGAPSPIVETILDALGKGP
ncbi:LysR substrate-binding domain-containing protein [Sphingobium estronivorans]|uniref:LysR substrate-binding domain-containing protein n=1 Tax=Sphingobium estronivorans TaxID=1577690 RepID=UPI0013C2E57F|nr:LysR substrate-binding domain-containing protein [Sphingobium estronivorans]